MEEAIDNFGYVITRNNYELVVLNNTNPVLNLSLKSTESCGQQAEVLKEVSLGVQESYTFKFPIKDGSYTLFISDGETESFLTIPIFDNLLNAILEDVEDYFCGECGCCKDCKEGDDKRAEMLLKIMSFYIVNRKYVSAYLDKAFECMECGVLEANFCYLYNDYISDKKELKELYDKIIATFYMAFYSADVALLNKDSNRISQYNKIKNCILAQGINTSCIEDKIKNMANFSVSWQAYVNQPPSVVGNYSTSQGNRSTLAVTTAMFTTATTPAYSDPEGDAAQAVRIDSLPTNGAVLKLDNINVTTGQVILMTDIAAGKLKLVGPDIGTLTTTVFTFSVRDTGSMTFKS